MDDVLRHAVEAASAAVGVDFSVYRETMVRRRVEHRMRMRQCSSYAAYGEVLRHDAAERWRLADALLIKTTMAFRDRKTWDAIRHVALPKLIAGCVRRGSPVLSAWVAGCATGEEAYSFAMAMAEARDRASVQLDVRVIATDVDSCALEHAARGLYRARAFVEAPREFVARYLEPHKGDEVRVAPAVRELVSWSHQSLTAPAGSALPDTVFASFEIVSCCNVMLYFCDDTRRAATARLLASCERDGILVLGEAEYPPLEFQRRLPPIAEGVHAFWVRR